jgi:hypothetical protein
VISENLSKGTTPLTSHRDFISAEQARIERDLGLVNAVRNSLHREEGNSGYLTDISAILSSAYDRVIEIIRGHPQEAQRLNVVA